MRTSARLAIAGCLIGLAACGPRNSPPADPDVPGASQPSAPVAGERRVPAAEASPPPLDPESPDGRLLGQPWTGDLEAMLERRYIRVLVIPDKMNFFFDGSLMRGVHYDAMREFEAFVNTKFKTGKKPTGLIFVPVRRDEILQALVDGRGDIAPGLGMSDERAAIVEFSHPSRDRVKVVPVGGPDSPPLASLDDLSGQEVYIPASSALTSLVANLNRKFASERRAPIVVQPADENLEATDILEMVNAGLVPFTLSDSLSAEFWAKVFDRLHVYSDVALTESGSIGWMFRKDSPQLKAVVNEFIDDHAQGTLFGNTLLRKYLSSTTWAKNAVADGELHKFKEMVALFRKYGAEANLPYLLVAAQAYQESGLNQDARSSVGAVGVMQIKPSTASGKPIEVENVQELANNIKAGTKYLRFLVDQYYADEPMDRVTKGLFAIASYNAGPARIQQLRRKARAGGLDPNRWFNNVELVAAKEIGRETVQYVANIYKYYLAYKLVTEHEAARAAAVKARKQSAGK